MKKFIRWLMADYFVGKEEYESMLDISGIQDGSKRLQYSIWGREEFRYTNLLEEINRLDKKVGLLEEYLNIELKKEEAKTSYCKKQKK
jgi:hypothetical protein